MTDAVRGEFAPSSSLERGRHRGEEQEVYIADVCTILPKLVDASDFAEVLFCRTRVGARINRLAAKFATASGIENRPCVIDIDELPTVVLGDQEDTPLCWGERIVERLSSSICRDDIGFLGVTYNNSSHQDYIPSLAAQIALKANLRLDEPPHQFTHYACATAIYSLQTALDYCRNNDRAAIVFCFDQNTWNVTTDLHADDPNLKQKMRSNLLFSDGAVGLLLIPESMRRDFARPLPRIVDTATGFHAGDLMRMLDGDFLVERDVRRVMPKLVMDKLIRPAMTRFGIAPGDVAEWSIHQGGPAVLDEFCKEVNLGLTTQQAVRSRDLFRRYGNFSGPSCLFVFDDYFHDPASAKKAADLGLIIGFGAGYYFGLAAYQWDA